MQALRLLLGVLLSSPPSICLKNDAEEIQAATRILKIVGGDESTKNEFPYQVGLMFKKKKLIECGGSIVNADWILTAAHCVEPPHNGEPKIQPSEVQVIAGERDVRIVEGHEQLMNVTKIIDHADYFSGINPKRDIALLKLARPLQLTRNVFPVQLAAKDRETETGLVTVAGWGKLKFGGKIFPPILRKVELPIVTLEECAKIYDDGNIEKDQICTGFLGTGGKDSCQGDSGGPLVKKEKTKYVQVGIVSYGASCADKRYPGVYTSVAAYRSWIDDTISQN